MALLVPPTHMQRWIAENSASFVPPICNKLLHKGRLSIMLVGGPNQRKDFHSEEGSEFFWQLKGFMEVVTIQNGKQKHVPIPEGHSYLLPSRVRHSPRRSANSIGLVIEREREKGELDSMCWFVDDNSTTILWEKYFVCTDLGKDLVPVVREFEQSNEFKHRTPMAAPLGLHTPLVSSVPDPISFNNLVSRVSATGDSISVFGNDHPDKEFDVLLEGSGFKTYQNREELFLMQIKGDGQIYNGSTITLREGECCVVGLDPSRPFITVSRNEGSVGLVISIKDLKGNKVGKSKL